MNSLFYVKIMIYTINNNKKMRLKEKKNKEK